jgi:hypothetical protein
MPFWPDAATAGHIAIEHRLERLPGLPLRMLRSERLDAIEDEGELEVDRLLGPERPVVVEGGDALLGRHELRAGAIGHRLDEREDALLGGAIVPGGQRIGLSPGAAE